LRKEPKKKFDFFFFETGIQKLPSRKKREHTSSQQQQNDKFNAVRRKLKRRIKSNKV